MFLLLTLNREMFTGIASSDCDTISIYCIIKFYIDFFLTIKLCCQEHVQVLCEFTRTNFQERNNFLLLFEYGTSKLARLGGYPTHRDVTDMSDLFYCHFEFI